MSEGDVSLIQDEDVLRRMWQQTEDFGKKKQIRAHMYKLREERLKNLYGNAEIAGEEAAATAEVSSEHQEKGPRPTPHSDSFADQCFQSLKTKEIRDSESPTRDIHYTVKDDNKVDGEWTVVSKEHVSDDGNTKMQSTIAHTSGSKEIDGGTATYAAMKENQNITSQYEDDNTKSFSSEKQTKSVAAEQSVSQTKDGSVSTSKTNVVSSTNVKNISHKIDDSADSIDLKNSVSDSIDNINMQQSTKKIQTKNQEMRHQSISNISDEQITQMTKGGKLLSREVNHPDSNTTIIIEKTQLPDGTIFTSTKKEIRGTSENINNSQSSQKSESQYTNVKKIASSNSQIIQSEGATKQISSSHRSQNDTDDVCDFSKHTVTNDDSISVISEASSDLSEKHALNMNEVVSHDSTVDFKSETKTENLNKNIKSSNVEDFVRNTEKEILPTMIPNVEANKEREEVVETFTKKKITELCNAKSDDIGQPAYCVPTNHPSIESDNNTTGEYVTTYQTDYTNKKISQDFSPTHEAWARSLRSSPDNPLRGGSPVRNSNRSLKSSMSSLRSSISPEKQTINRSPSPKKKNSSPERWSPTTGRQVAKHSSSPSERYNKSPDKSILKNDKEYTNKYSNKTTTHENKQNIYTDNSKESYERNSNSPRRFSPSVSPNRNSPRTSSPEKSPSISPSRRPTPAINMGYDYKPRDLKSPIHDDFILNDFTKRSSMSPTRYTIDSSYTKSSRDNSPTKSISENEFSTSKYENKNSDIDSSTLTRKSSLKKIKPS